MGSVSRVSIIIPCYNDGKYLPEAVASARAQTHPSTEIIIVDDHSTDPKTQAIYEQFRNEGIPVLQTPPGRKGPSAARNTGIAAATGEYILPLDADDAIAPSYAGKAAAVLDADPAIGICYCHARFFGLKSGPWHMAPYSFNELLCGNMIFATAMFRKADWARAGGFAERLTAGFEDYAFWLRLAHQGARVHQLEEELFFYRIKRASRTARCAFEHARHMRALADVHTACADIFASHSDVLLQRITELRDERDHRECLFSWKVCAPLFRLEWALRQRVKKFLGRC